MTSVARSLMELVARTLTLEEREAVLGDLAECGVSSRQGLVEVLGLAVRRQVALWSHWRPWLAGFGMALPGTLLLLGVSYSISCTYQRLASLTECAACSPTGQEDLLLLLCQIALLIIWSWTAGFAVGSVSRRTLWVSVAVSIIPCVLCLANFREASVSRFCVLLFLPPAILGARCGLGSIRIKRRSAMGLASVVTVLMICAWSGSALWSRNWALILPAWYIVMLTWRSNDQFVS